ncbi:hypothetical protein HNQ95_001417 [Aminobacter ciceronei]|jgi:hypothetical protein|uniref:Uncharacterized protein n=1 Tax=Aminobacter ciceronei TaxID=150723 RepID=A0ABR6C351_9HYPH|nr:hypothetical protein [Aminobacter ciceronei]MBA9019427.1 hypothetical protein [Aminobacter ciceronei]
MPMPTPLHPCLFGLAHWLAALMAFVVVSMER